MNAVQSRNWKLFDGCKIIRHYLRNVYGWTLVYETVDSGPDWNTVRIKRSYKGESEPELLMTRGEARAHYAAMQRQGFVSRLTTI